MASSLRVQPSALSVLQRQMTTDGLASSRCLTKSGGPRNASVRLTTFDCCQRASRVASSSRSRLQPPTQERRERRSFFTSTRLQQDLDLGPDDRRRRVDDLHLTRQAEKGGMTTSESTGKRRPVRRIYGKSSSPVRQSKVMVELYDEIPTTREDFARFQSSRIHKGITAEEKEDLLHRLLLFIGREPAMMQSEMKDCTTSSETMAVAQRHLDKSYFALLAIAQLGGDRRKVVQQVGTAGEFANFGDRLINFRGEKVAFARLQNRVGMCLDLMIKPIEERLGSQHVPEWAASVVQCLRSQAFSFQSNELAARRLLAEVLADEREWLSEWEEATSSVLRAQDRYGKFRRLQHLADALGSLLQIALNRSENVEPEAQDKMARNTMNWLASQPSRLHFNSFNFPRVAFRLNVLTGRLLDPLQYLQSTIPTLVEDARPMLASSICASLLRQNSVLPAYNIYVWLKSIRYGLREPTMRQMIRVAVAEKEFALAGVIMNDLGRRAEKGKAVLASSTCRLLAFSYSQMQDEKNMEKIINLYRTQYGESSALNADRFVYECRLFCYVEKGDVERAKRLIETRHDMECGPRERPKDGLLSPDYQTHARLVVAYLNNGCIDEAEAMLHRMVRFGHPPSVSLLNAVLKFYVGLGDTHSVLSLFRKMVEAGLKVDVDTYTTLISLFAKMKDSQRAETVFETMKMNGTRPDRAAYTALLNAYVEAGHYKEAVVLFERMLNQGKFSIRPSTIAYNVILKAHVLRAASVQETVHFFKHMKSKGMEASPETYGMLLLSVTDAGLMDLAEDVFASVETLLGGQFDTETGKGAGMYHFTAMIQGYLRVGKVKLARDYAIELRNRGFKATGVLWAILVKAYAGGDASTNMEESYRLVQNVAFNSKQDYAAAYDPLIHAYSKRADVTQVEFLLRELSDKGSEIPLNFWVSLLDGFRRRDDVGEVMELWKLIFEKAQKKAIEAEMLSTAAGLPPSPKTRLDATKEKEMRSSLLCVPLSILIDTLSRHDKHREIAEEWIRCRKAGFAFDSHNWNHLCVSFLKAGRVRDSLNIIEQVLHTSPPERELDSKTMESIVERDRQDASPSHTSESTMPGERNYSRDETFFSAIDPLDLITSPSRPPNRRSQRRSSDDSSTQNPLQSDPENTEGSKKKLPNHVEGDSPSSLPSNVSLSERAKEVKEHRDTESDRLLRMEPLLRESRSPWYAHFETMWQLKKSVERIQNRGGIIQLGHNQLATLKDLFKMFPRVKQLLAIFERKVENMQEVARVEAVRRDSRRR